MKNDHNFLSLSKREFIRTIRENYDLAPLEMQKIIRLPSRLFRTSTRRVQAVYHLRLLCQLKARFNNIFTKIFSTALSHSRPKDYGINTIPAKQNAFIYSVSFWSFPLPINTKLLRCSMKFCV